MWQDQVAEAERRVTGDGEWTGMDRAEVEPRLGLLSAHNCVAAPLGSRAGLDTKLGWDAADNAECQSCRQKVWRGVERGSSGLIDQFRDRVWRAAIVVPITTGSRQSHGGLGQNPF